MLRVDIERAVGEFSLRPRWEAGAELVVLFGPSGCGKSMTLQAIAGLVRPARGRIEIGDEAVFDRAAGVDVAPQHRGVGYVVQDLALFPHMTAAENIAFGLASWPAGRRRERVAALMSTMDLVGLESRKPAQLSGGQQQRVALARALAGEPQLLLLDEPFAGLDQGLRAVLRREVVGVRKRLGLTAVFVTHDLAEAYSLADRVVVMDDGAVLQQGPRDEVFGHPASKRVAELTDVGNIIPAEVVAYAEGVSVVRTQWFTARVPATGPAILGKVSVCIRREHVLLLREGRQAHEAGDAVVEGEVVEDTPLGNTHRLLVRVEANEGAGDALILEVDVPAHPYEVLGVATRREWPVVLTASHMTLAGDE